MQVLQDNICMLGMLQDVTYHMALLECGHLVISSQVIPELVTKG